MAINLVVLACSDNRTLTESYNLSGSIFSPTISGGNIDKRRQHWYTGEFQAGQHIFVVDDKGY